MAEAGSQALPDVRHQSDSGMKGLERVWWGSRVLFSTAGLVFERADR